MSFIRDYIEYSEGNEAPEMFHIWSGYVALSASVSRRVWLPDGDDFIFPNIYVMLVGDAGCGKSTALRRAKRMLSELEDIPISRSVETPEGLWRFMAGDPDHNPPIESPVAFLSTWPDGKIRECHPMTIVANEFVNFISKDREGWTGALNDIYDSDNYEYRTKNKGEDLLMGPYIVLLGALTTDISNELQKVKIISTGFARRTIFQYGERKFHDPHAFQTFNKNQQDARLRCIEFLRKLKKVYGKMTLTQEALVWWKLWYDSHTRQIPEVATPQTLGWYSSKTNQVLKLGMLSSLSEDPTILKLDVSHLKMAINYLGEMEKEMFKVFGGVGRNELASVSVQVFDFVSKKQLPVPYTELKNHFFSFANKEEFEACMEFLTSSNKLVQVQHIVRNGAVTFIGSPDSVARMNAVGVEVVLLESAARTGSPLVAAHVVDPSTSPVNSPVDHLQPAPAVAEPVGGTVVEPPPLVG